jgi:hypothetical protein
MMVSAEIDVHNLQHKKSSEQMSAERQAGRAVHEAISNKQLSFSPESQISLQSRLLRRAKQAIRSSKRTCRAMKGVVGRKCEEEEKRAPLIRGSSGAVDAAAPLECGKSERAQRPAAFDCAAVLAFIGSSTTGATEIPAVGVLMICIAVRPQRYTNAATTTLHIRDNEHFLVPSRCASEFLLLLLPCS